MIGYVVIAECGGMPLKISHRKTVAVAWMREQRAAMPNFVDMCVIPVPLSANGHVVARSAITKKARREALAAARRRLQLPL
jgi:hypothetical protein